MSDREERQEAGDEVDFEPRGTRTLTLLYLLIIAAAWALVYFGDLLARR